MLDSNLGKLLHNILQDVGWSLPMKSGKSWRLVRLIWEWVKTDQQVPFWGDEEANLLSCLLKGFLDVLTSHIQKACFGGLTLTMMTATWLSGARLLPTLGLPTKTANKTTLSFLPLFAKLPIQIKLSIFQTSSNFLWIWSLYIIPIFSCQWLKPNQPGRLQERFQRREMSALLDDALQSTLRLHRSARFFCWVFWGVTSFWKGRRNHIFPREKEKSWKTNKLLSKNTWSELLKRFWNDFCLGTKVLWGVLVQVDLSNPWVVCFMFNSPSRQKFQPPKSDACFEPSNRNSLYKSKNSGTLAFTTRLCVFTLGVGSLRVETSWPCVAFFENLILVAASEEANSHDAVSYLPQEKIRTPNLFLSSHAKSEKPL